MPDTPPVGPELQALLDRFGVGSLEELVPVVAHYRTFPTAAGGSGPGIGSGLWQTIEGAISFGLGFAAAAALEPLSTSITQEFFNIDPSRALYLAMVAEIRAQQIKDEEWGHTEASYTGFNTGRIDAAIQSRITAPAAGTLIQLLRRKAITSDDVVAGLVKAKLPPQWHDPILGLQHKPLAPSQIATAIHRNIIPAPDLIVREPPRTEGRVPQVPQSTIDPVTSAEWSGLDSEQLRVLVGITGLPLSLTEMLQLLNRGEVTEDDVRRAVAQSNTRNEYMDVALGLRRRLLTPHDYAELQLRGFLKSAERDAGAALSGMEPADAQLLYDLLGRSIPAHQITTGFARGGEYEGPTDHIPAAYLASLERGNLRPEYYNLAYANRYTIPNYFVLRPMLQQGVITEQEGAEYFRQNGWPPDLADKAAQFWAGGSKTVADPHVKKAETSLYTAAHKFFVTDDGDEATAKGALTALQVPEGAQAEVIALWTHERELVRKQLTPSQIKKAYKDALYTEQEALAILERRGYSTADATTLLQE